MDAEDFDLDILEIFHPLDAWVVWFSVAMMRLCLRLVKMEGGKVGFEIVRLVQFSWDWRVLLVLLPLISRV